MTLKHRELAGIDLNLLVSLDALLTERSVTRAARQVGIGQSAMSSSLARLRKLLGDELLTRASDGMQLTPRGKALVEPVRAALRQFQSLVLREDTFDPSTVERGFTIAVPGDVESHLVPRLLAFMQREAPGVRLTLRAINYDKLLNELDTDQVDLGIGMITEGQNHHKLRSLYRFGFLCLFNADLLGVHAPLSLADYLRFPHIMTSLTGADRGLVDAALAAIGKQRKLVATTPRFTTVPLHVQAAPLISTMVDQLALTFAARLGLSTSPVPVPLDELTTSMIWHASYDHDPAHRWLRGVLARLSREATIEQAKAAV